MSYMYLGASDISGEICIESREQVYEIEVARLFIVSKSFEN